MNAPTEDPMEDLIAAACRAPSSHNTQPWLFGRDGNAIGLYADRTRALPVNDPMDRELTISCGAALFNLLVAADAAGLHCEVDVFPNVRDTDHLASIRLQPGKAGRYAALIDAIGLRRTHRGGFSPDDLAPEIVSMLDAAVAEHDVTLNWIHPGPERDAIADLVAAGDRTQFADQAWRRELASWMRTPSGTDGLPSPVLTGWLIRSVVSHFDVGRGTARKDAELLRRAPLVGVLATHSDQPTDWLIAGQALEHLLLVAASRGIMAGYSNQPCQVPKLRQRLQDSIAIDGAIQVVIRFGVPDTNGARAPRRAVSEVLTAGSRRGDR